ncbi:acyl-CoA synthetase (AMP-forming)/AMP-acid ligase II [Kitasatospora sp. SolWspMP-SS2h]|uniref:class I adenylate-forming enzyme family protein n=1 Tax=Kitasatospora sp. SolWspMP-SS2h TaxID=1305729 RepID=UPI000DB97DB0|nr:class I adenylate-forming enzyme family protein [Kitasatospora sp. SolWspMP-SS2h]RAJ46196.1 acyl-CoA synthetase (AMP-forming)/AMP-acid ligase II [Kitasatospora sp. SolWspMP-SS2h]
MSLRTLRAVLSADSSVGAGNVLTTRVEQGLGLDSPTLTFDTPVDGHPAGTALTLRQLDLAVRARAAALHARGVRRRDPVAVQASAAAEQVLCFLALSRLGAIPALLNPALDADTSARYLRRLNAVGLLADAAHAKALADVDFGAPVLADTAELADGDPESAPEPYRHWPTDPVAITHSSGTTGLPKAVLHSHQSLYAAIRHRLLLPRPQGIDRVLSALPAAHAATLIAVNLALSFDAQLHLISQQSGPAVLEAIERWQPLGVYGFATTWADLARQDLSARDLSSVGLWWNTGDCAHEAHIRRLVAQGSRETATRQGRVRTAGSVFIDGLGSSEMGHSHFFITHTVDSERYGRCVGRPHAFVDCAVLDPDGNELGPGEVGELGTRSPTLSPGYWNDSVTTHRTRVRDYFLTGDLVYRDEDGYYYHVDRAVDTVDLGDGRRLHTAASEERVLAACPDVHDCTVVAFRDGGRTVADVLLQLDPAADQDADRTAEVLAALEPHVAAVVRTVLAVPDGRIPLGPTGKVRKVLLRQRHLAEAGTGAGAGIAAGAGTGAP